MNFIIHLLKKKLFLSREILLLVYFHSIFCGFFHLFNAFSSLNTFILRLDFLTFSNRLPLLVTSPPGFKYPYNTLFTHSSSSCPSVCWHTQICLCKFCSYFFLTIFNSLCSTLPRTVITYFDIVLLLNIPPSWSFFIYCNVSCDFLFPLFFACSK